MVGESVPPSWLILIGEAARTEMVETRCYQPEDAEAVTEIANSSAPGHRTVSVEQMRFWDETRDPQCRTARLARPGHRIGPLSAATESAGGVRPTL
ncbi:MAG: hypothetical protein WCP58_07410 [bacterium]